MAREAGEGYEVQLREGCKIRQAISGHVKDFIFLLRTLGSQIVF